MPPAQHAAIMNGDFEIDTKAHIIRLTREFDAPAALIYQAWTQPEHLSCWWDAAGEPLAICEIDAKIGGAFKFVTRSHREMAFTGVYRELSPPDRIVFEALGAIGRVRLQEASGRTQMTVEIECSSAEHLDQYLKMGVAAGTSKTLDNLVAYARGLSA